MKTIRASETGQILVLLVLVLIGLLGFTALAVDGGMIYADRRFMQSAADAASLAGAGAAADQAAEDGVEVINWDCTALADSISTAYSNAISQANTNDFLVSQIGTVNATADNYVDVVCNGTEKYLDVIVVLSKNTTTSFVHLFNKLVPMRNTVTSISRIYPMYSLGSGYSIVALRKGPCDSPDIGVTVSGTSDITIQIGGIWSNSCLTFNGGVNVDIDTGGIVYNTTDLPYDQNGGSGTIDPTPDDTTELHPATDKVFPFDENICDLLPSFGVMRSGGADPKVAGRYTGLDLHNNGVINLAPGLYCITGTVKMTGGEIHGRGVTIYYEGTDFTINGGVIVELYAPNALPVPQSAPIIAVENHAYEDLLLYVPVEFQADIKLNGGADSIFSGTIYAPSSFITVEGNADASTPTTYAGSIIGYDVKVAGTPGLSINYDPNQIPDVPSYLEQHK